MTALSVVVTAYNLGPFVGRSLQSVHDALALFHAEFGGEVGSEVIVVDDGSADETPRVVQSFVAGRDGWRVLRRPGPSSPGAARNAGVEQAQGDFLFFLDGDDLYLPPHLAACWRALRDPGLDYVKTGVRLADPVHPDWRGPVEHSLVINLCVKRSCHDAVGGFPDYHLHRREGGRMVREAEVFLTGEDQAYNRLLAGLFRGGRVAAETVQYVRRPGNAYDRQYEKFRRPRRTHPETTDAEEEYRLGLAEVVVRKRLTELRRSVPGAASSAAAAALAAVREGLRSGDGRRAEQACRRGLESDPNEAAFGACSGRRYRGRASTRRPPTPSAGRCSYFPRTPTATPAWPRRWRRWAAATRRRSGSAAPCSFRPGDADVLAQLGLLLAGRGRLDEAVGLLLQATQARPDLAPAFHNLGAALAQQGKPDEAARRWRRRCGCGRTTPRRSTTLATSSRGWAAATRPANATARRCGCGPATARPATISACC